MRGTRSFAAAILLAVALPARAADPAPSGSVTEEILKTGTVRVTRLTLAAGGTTGQHTHAVPHLAVALTDGTLTSVAPDGTGQARVMKEGMLAWVPADLHHALRNDGSEEFFAMTFDLLTPQTGVRNRCAAILPGQPTDCAKPAKKSKGALRVPQLETDQMVVSLLTLDQGAEYPFKDVREAPVVGALAGTDAKALVTLKIAGAVGRGEKPLQGGDAASTTPNAPLTLRNSGPLPARFIVLEFK